MNIAAESEHLYGISSDDQIPDRGQPLPCDICFNFVDINVKNVA
jgi:hypothetical protein